MKTLVLSIVIVLAAAGAKAQYRYTYTSGNGDDVTFTCVIKYFSGDLMVAGKVGNDIILMRVDAADGSPVGTPVVIETPGTDVPEVMGLILDSDGKLVMCGILDPTSGVDNSDERGFVIRYDYAAGAVLWATYLPYDNSLYDDITEVGNGGGYYVCGEYDDQGNGGHYQDGIIDSVVRVNGDIINKKRDAWISNGSSSDTYGALIRSKTNLYLAGRFTHNGTGQMRPVLERCDAYGNNCDKIDFYLKKINAEARMYFYDITESTENHTGNQFLYMVGFGNYSSSASPPYQDLFVTKTDLSGTIKWANDYQLNAGVYNGTLTNVKTHKKFNLVNSIVALGSSYDGASQYNDLLGNQFIIDLKTDGNVRWSHKYEIQATHGITNQRNALLVSGDNIYLVGRDDQVPVNGVLYCIPESDGKVGTPNSSCYDTLAVTYTSLTYQDSDDIVRDNYSPIDDNLVVTQSTASIQKGNSCLSLYVTDGEKPPGQNDNMNRIHIEALQKNRLMIETQQPELWPAQLMLFDCLGRKVMELTVTDDENLQTGLPSGIYFFRISDAQGVMQQGAIYLDGR